MNDFCIFMLTLKQFIKRNFSSWIYRSQKAPARKNEFVSWLREIKKKPVSKLSDASFDVFTYHGEDGILFYLLDLFGDVPPNFVDIGAGDCVKSNCANLAVHFNWNGLFIDKNPDQLSIGRQFYKNKIAAGASIRFTEAEVRLDNVNQLVKDNGGAGLLSIDIDGNDYWVWNAIDTIQPEIVVIEAKVEFGHRSIVVPCGSNNHASVDAAYNGASVEALRKLGLSKGYKMVGANKQGYNLFFVKQHRNLPEASTEEILDDPGTVQSFYQESFFTTHQFENI